MNANMAMDVRGRTIAHYVPSARGGDARARPRPLEIEAADPAVDVENLADQEQSRAHTREAIVDGSISSSETPPAVTSA